MSLDEEALKREVTFKTSRSSGAGGQHVNKVETRVTLIWDVDSSLLFSPAEKEMIRHRLVSRINAEGKIQLDVSETRSQVTNKKLALTKLVILLTDALQPVQKRIKTKIPRSKVLERLDRKRKQAAKKADRSWRMD